MKYLIDYLKSSRVKPGYQLTGIVVVPANGGYVATCSYTCGLTSGTIIREAKTAQEAVNCVWTRYGDLSSS